MFCSLVEQILRPINGIVGPNDSVKYMGQHAPHI